MAEVVCDVISSPVPVVVWYYQDKEITEEHRSILEQVPPVLSAPQQSFNATADYQESVTLTSITSGSPQPILTWHSLLVLQPAGPSACWSFSLLVLQPAGPSTCWSFSLLVLQHAGPSTCWSFSLLVLQPAGPSTCWSFSLLVLQHAGPSTCWSFSLLVLQPAGPSACWSFSLLVLQPAGPSACFFKGRYDVKSSEQMAKGRTK
ncbi:hypothetical protein NHX12_015235 [Muraenolepis orangiensis]|uniref:Ig-like domain-containing protein n=1 Tax=Muraenolepis orangiensis TaxID=630683 RepID=A0A9Q0I4B5_9TELE|nr:hypothetical protein NHX12_015235 [Muraenolepis orangiensis]